MKLVLFDIDGTILDSGGAGSLSLNLAFEEIFSIRSAFRGISLAGKTDIQILKEGLRNHDLDSENGNLTALCESYIRHLRVRIENPRRHLKPGVRETVAALEAMDGISLGLLTGNIEAGARIKLQPFDLNRFFPFGAFGDDDEDRNRLLPLARERFRSLHRKEVEYRDCIIIGDTPRDIECAKTHGAYSLAVATGPYSHALLVDAGADMVLNDLAEIDLGVFRQS